MKGWNNSPLLFEATNYRCDNLEEPKMIFTEENFRYWKSKLGADYRRTQELRTLNGQAIYMLQAAWLKTYLRARLFDRRSRLRLLDFGCGFGRRFVTRRWGQVGGAGKRCAGKGRHEDGGEEFVHGELLG